MSLSIALFAGSATMQSDRPGTQPEPPWLALERELKDQGVSTDVRTLIAIAKSQRDSGTRWFAIEILGLRGNREAIETLRQVLKTDTDPLIQETTALALARLGQPDAVGALLQALQKSTSAHRRLFLAARLAELGDPTGYPIVVEAASSEDAGRKYASVTALLAFVPLRGSKGGMVIDPVERLVALARDEDPKVRHEVVINVPVAVKKGVPLSVMIPVVTHLAKADPDPQVREAARLRLLELR